MQTRARSDANARLRLAKHFAQALVGLVRNQPKARLGAGLIEALVDAQRDLGLDQRMLE